MNCPKCKTEMELVDTHYNLELEAEYGHPVEIKTFVCPKCNHQEQEENNQVSKSIPSEFDVDPAEPWTDPISGEVDYDAMAEDLGCPEMGDNPEDYNEGDYY